MTRCIPLSVIVVLLSACTLMSCVPEEIMLHGNISGTVNDVETNQPLKNAAIELIQSQDAIAHDTTDTDGSYLFRNLYPGDYKVQVSLASFEKTTRDAAVSAANTTQLDFGLIGAPVPSLSDPFLDFGFDADSKVFTISNIGKGNLRYTLSASQNWIELFPPNGEATIESDTIRVNIARERLSSSKHTEMISIISYIGDEIKLDTVKVFVNGVADQDGNNYSVVTIGGQTWMAENLKTGETIEFTSETSQTDNQILEKYCFDNREENCDIYGGLYNWYEMMQYPPADYDPTEIIQGVCPDGWHLPSQEELITLRNYLGGISLAGGRMKDTGTIQDGTGLWKSPNEGATNESGFAALPGGTMWFTSEGLGSDPLGELFGIWSTNSADFSGYLQGAVWWIEYDKTMFSDSWAYAGVATSVRCIKNP